MGRYDDESYLTVEYAQIPNLLKDVVLGKSRVRLSGDYTKYEIRANLVPYNPKTGDLLLYKTVHRVNGHAFCTLEIPQRLVTVPNDFNTGCPLTHDGFKHILASNLYMAVLKDTTEIENHLQFDENSLQFVLRRMGLGGDNLDYNLMAYPDQNVMLDEHCVDVYMMLKVDYVGISSDFYYIPAGIFEQYCNSKYPTSYAMILGFHEDDYDETSSDFRMNPKGKAQICAAIKYLRAKEIVV